MYTCAKCGQTGCTSRNMEKTLPECPSKNEAVQKKALEKYEQGENQRIAYHSACTEAEVMCNPIGQAEILNEAGTEFNVVMGLCVGHDTLFFKYIESPVTVLAVKDRVTGHNPLAPVYCAQGYYKNKFYPEKEGER